MKYTVDDINRLRAAIIKRGEVVHPNPYGEQDEVLWAKTIEERLRTYMLAGVTPREMESAPILVTVDENGFRDLV